MNAGLPRGLTSDAVTGGRHVVPGFSLPLIGNCPGGPEPPGAFSSGHELGAPNGDGPTPCRARGPWRWLQGGPAEPGYRDLWSIEPVAPSRPPGRRGRSL
jgi:hypothetical protein